MVTGVIRVLDDFCSSNIPVPNSGISLNLHCTSQGWPWCEITRAWLVQMTAGQIIAYPLHNCNSTHRRGELKKADPTKTELDSLDETTTQQQLQASLGESLQQEIPWWHRRALESVKATILLPAKPFLGTSPENWTTGGSHAFNNRQSSCMVLAKPTTTTGWGSTPRITMWLPPIQRYSRHDIHCTATPRKMLWTKAAFIYGFHLTKAFDMVDRQGPVEYTIKVRLSWQVYQNIEASTWWHGSHSA